MMGAVTIKSRVMAAINQKLKDIEAKHVEACLKIDQDAKLEKDKHADKMVQEILGKVI